MKKFFIGLLFILIDQITKLIQPRDFSFWFLQLRGVCNRGLSFGLSGVGSLLSLMIAVFCLGFLAYYFIKHRPLRPRSAWAVCLILSGGASNILDRFVFGCVRDFIDLGLFTFNLADAMVFLGVVLLVLPLSTPKWKN